MTIGFLEFFDVKLQAKQLKFLSIDMGNFKQDDWNS